MGKPFLLLQKFSFFVHINLLYLCGFSYYFWVHLQHTFTIRYFLFACTLKREITTIIFNGSKCCHILLKTVGLRMPNRNFRDFRFFNFDLKRRNCFSAQSASAANATDSDIDIVNISSISINDFQFFKLSVDISSFNFGTIFVIDQLTFCAFLLLFLWQETVLSLLLALRLLCQHINNKELIYYYY